jgi:hypothetical protein
MRERRGGMGLAKGGGRTREEETEEYIGMGEGRME